jgi:sec-independent protein translocase protein TatA
MSTSLFAMLHMPEIIALLVLALILFGAKKLPELARGLGSGIKEFKKATRDVTEELQARWILIAPRRIPVLPIPLPRNPVRMTVTRVTASPRWLIRIATLM